MLWSARPVDRGQWIVDSAVGCGKSQWVCRKGSKRAAAGRIDKKDVLKQRDRWYFASGGCSMAQSGPIRSVAGVY